MPWVDSDISVEALYCNWLLGYSSLRGPIAGIMNIDYFVTNKQQLDLGVWKIIINQDRAG